MNERGEPLPLTTEEADRWAMHLLERYFAHGQTEKGYLKALRKDIARALLEAQRKT